MRRLTLRARLTLVFALAMAVVFAGIGLLVDLRVAQSLRATVDQGLRARAVDVASLAAQSDNGLRSARSPFAAPGDSFGQLIDPRHHVYDSTPGLGRRPLLSAAQLRRAHQGPYFLALEAPRGAPGRAFVAPIRAQGESLVLLVGTSVAASRSVLASVQNALLIGCPIALLIACAGGYLLAGAALAPVERMRAHAARVSAASHGTRLPVPDADDEITRLGHTLNEMLERLQRAHDREQQFVADASHELRTPLSLLKTEIEIALDRPHSSAELRDALRSAGEETDRLVQLAEDLLLLAQSDNGTLPTNLVAIDAHELLERMVARFALRASGIGRDLVVRAPAKLTVMVDSLRIEQALGNLIDNALRHGAGTITLFAQEHEQVVELHVSDDGDGIPVEFRAHAFERFSRGDTARHRAGAGLGLAIVAAIAEAHGGRARLGDRSDVYLRLPSSTDELGRPRAALLEA